MTFEMCNNSFYLVRVFCVMFTAWPRPWTWPHALMASLASLHISHQCLLFLAAHSVISIESETYLDQHHALNWIYSLRNLTSSNRIDFLWY